MSSLPKPISEMLVRELKEELEKRKLPTSGVKAQLAKRLEEALKSEEEKPPTNKETNGDAEMKESESSAQVEKEQETTSQADKSSSTKEQSKKEDTRESPNTQEHPKEQPKEQSQEQPTDKTSTEKVSDKKHEANGKKTDDKDERMGVETEKKRKLVTEDSNSTTTDTTTTTTNTNNNNNDSSSTKEKESTTEPKRRRWGSGKTAPATPTSVSTDTIKNILNFDPETRQKEKEKDEKEKQQQQQQQPTQLSSPPADRNRPIATTRTVAQTSSLFKRAVAEAAPREVPPSSRPASNALFISGFVRPFTKNAVKELFDKTGTVRDWGMDNIRSKAFVIYETVEQATATRDALHNLVWPATNHSKLQVDYATEDEARKRANQSPAAAAAASSDTGARGVGGSGRDRETRDRVREGERDSSVNNNAQPAQSPVKQVTLDDLFRKTAAKPHLYYLPLTDEQVAERRNKLSGADGAKESGADKDTSKENTQKESDK